MKKVLTILGARPQFIKAAAVSRIFQQTEGITEVIVNTGQHFDHNMSQVFVDELGITPPHYNLDINGGSHAQMVGRMLPEIEEVILKEKPDGVLVYGDTNSTLAAALTARKLQVPVFHIEAGLRSFNMEMPEEVNRILTDQISDLLFCPTQTAMDHLTNEKLSAGFGQAILSGDVMLDAFKHYGKTSAEQTFAKPFVLATVHRQENTDDESRFRSIIDALNKINQQMEVRMPVHPRTRKRIEALDLSIEFQLIDPIGYLEMIAHLQSCELVLTDSGGLQKEAFFAEKYCLTLRDETEWVELIELGVNALVGADPAKIAEGFETFKLKDKFPAAKLYGSGNASEKIVDAITAFLG